jgi:hypothetical protein
VVVEDGGHRPLAEGQGLAELPVYGGGSGHDRLRSL